MYVDAHNKFYQDFSMEEFPIDRMQPYTLSTNFCRLHVHAAKAVIFSIPKLPDRMAAGSSPNWTMEGFRICWWAFRDICSSGSKWCLPSVFEKKRGGRGLNFLASKTSSAVRGARWVVEHFTQIYEEELLEEVMFWSNSWFNTTVEVLVLDEEKLSTIPSDELLVDQSVKDNVICLSGWDTEGPNMQKREAAVSWRCRCWNASI